MPDSPHRLFKLLEMKCGRQESNLPVVSAKGDVVLAGWYRLMLRRLNMRSSASSVPCIIALKRLTMSI